MKNTMLRSRKAGYSGRYQLTAMLVCTIMTGVATAQRYPAHPVRMVIPFPSGGSIDTVARPFAQALAETLGQNVVVDNRGAGGGVLGTEVVAKAPPDGYTILMTNVAFAITPSLIKTLPYNPVKDFIAVSQLTTLPYLLVATPSLAATTLPELVALARAKPGHIAYGSLGNGSGSHLAGVMLRDAAAIDVLHVPYKGFGALLPDLATGRVHLTLNTIPGLLQHVRSGRVRALTLTAAKRSALLPEVPTSAEAGLPRFDPSTWHGVLVPAGTPASVVAALNSAIGTVLGTVEMKERLTSQGADAAAGTPQAFTAFLRREIERWSKVVVASGATVD